MGVARLGHSKALDGLRGVAILLVLAAHLVGYRGGGLGVDVFFVLSGFLITSLLLEEHERSGRISLRGFYGRRTRRIMPALWFYTVVCVIGAAALRLFFHGFRLVHWLSGVLIAVTYTANISKAYGIGHLPDPFGHFWSLAAEEQFYLVWPPLLMLLLACRISSRVLVLLVTAIAAASLGWQLALTFTGASSQRVWLGPDTHLAPIAVGCLAAIVYNRRLIPMRSIRVLWPAALAVCAIVIAVPPFNSRWLFDGPFSVFPFACAIVLLAAVDGAAVARPLSLRPLRWTGKISYSLYLWHVPLFFAFSYLGLPIAFVAAWFSYRYVEQPFLTRNRRRPVLELAPTPALVD
jgi:peptidoglycan/LPS O-acetylase OafA/YrhL